jgi:hypothetical protein
LEYEVDDKGVMQAWTQTPLEELEYATFSKIRVLAYDGLKRFIDLQIEVIKSHLTPRVFEKTPLTRSQYDPRGNCWKRSL